MKSFKELREFKTALSFFDLKSATKAERLAKNMGILKDSEKKGKQYTVYVDGKFTDITKWLKKLDTSENVNEDYAQDLDLAQKNIARLAKKETGQDKKDYMAVARALNQGNLGAVKKVIKGISTDEIRADILNVLVGYNDLIAKMYPKAVDAKGRLKSGMSVGKMIKDDTEVSESDANWAKSLEKINKQKQLDKISNKDKETLMKIAALLGKEKKRR